jgi:hypothetical protein
VIATASIFSPFGPSTKVHHASLPHQKTSLTHRIFLGGECSAHTFPIRSWIEIVAVQVMPCSNGGQNKEGEASLFFT